MADIDDLIEEAARVLLDCDYVIALTGAGMSTESGIPDFRGPSGIWTTDPEAEQRAHRTYDKFLDDPIGYWEDRLTTTSPLGDLARVEPNPGHFALGHLEKAGILQMVITQNIDNLHQRAGSSRVLDYHGNVSKLRCFDCGERASVEEYDLHELRRTHRLSPKCKKCGGTLKSDVVHFKEPIPSDVARASLEEAWRCDGMLLCGTSAVVYPFANLPRIARQRMRSVEERTESGLHIMRRRPATPIIEINLEPTPLTQEGVSDLFISGKTGEVLPRLVTELLAAGKTDGK